MRYSGLFLIVSYILGSALMSVCGCTSRRERIPVERLDYAIEESDTMSSSRLDSLNRRYESGIRALYRANAANSELVAGEGLKGLRFSNSLVFTPAVRERADNLEEVELALGKIKHRMASLLPGTRFPSEIYAVEWPFSQTMAIVNDTVLLIAMNHYLGADFEGYSGFDDYKKKQKTLQRLPYDVAEAVIRTALPFERDGATVVGRMIYEGAVADAVSKLVPGADEMSALGYDDNEMKWAQSNEYPVWQTMAASGVLFSSSEFDMGRLVDPAPATSSIHPDAPGRLGRYMGYQLVKSLREQEPDLSETQILSSSVYGADNILQLAKYLPPMPR